MYPIYMQMKHGTGVVKFTDLQEGTVIIPSNQSGYDYYVGYYSLDWIPHTDTSIWQPYNPFKSNSKDTHENL